MKKLCFLAAILVAAANVQAQIVQVPLPNPGFEEPGENSFPGGFEATPNVPGWFDLTPPTDAGIEGPAAWWGTYNGGFSAFMAPGNGAYNISEYTILAGEEYTVGFVSKSWDGATEWTVSLFYDDPGNVIGTFSTGVNGTWTEYFSPSLIAATGESVGGTLGISFLNTGNGFGNLDNVSVTVIPEPSTLSMIAVLSGVGLLVRRRMMRAS